MYYFIEMYIDWTIITTPVTTRLGEINDLSEKLTKGDIPHTVFARSGAISLSDRFGPRRYTDEDIETLLVNRTSLT